MDSNFTSSNYRHSQQKQILRQEISQLLYKRAIEPVTDNTPGFYTPMFTIPKRTGGFRPVFNLWRLNQYLQAPHFKMETLTEVLRMIRPKDYLTSIDPSDAFLHLLIHKASRKYLRFHWDGQTYQFRTAPFGLSLVPWLFTKITKPILTWARQQQIRLSAYLDDWILIGTFQQNIMEQTTRLVNKLQSLGWIINLPKSILTPTQSLEHLGFQINTQLMTIQLPSHKICNIRRQIQQLLSTDKATPRQLLSIAMRLQAATIAIFPARIYTQQLLRFKNRYVQNSRHWDQLQALPTSCKMELTWWQTNLQTWNGRSFIQRSPTTTLYVDASNTGWGAHCQEQRISGLWTHKETQHHINWKELRAVQLALQTFHHLQHTTILVKTDNTTSMAYLNKHGGTRSLRLGLLATEIWTLCLQRGLTLTAQHLPRTSNTIADYESRRTFAKNAWYINDDGFARIQNLYGTHDIGLFADRTTARLPRYVSWKPALSWSTFRHPLIHPPWNLTSRSLSKIRQDQVQATVITPYWPSALWFPELQELSLQPPLLLNPCHSIRTATPLTPWPFKNNQWKLAVAGLRRRYEEMEGLSDTAREILIDHHTNDSPTNRTYRRGQQLFVQWAIRQEIDVCNFTRTDFINFLVAASHNVYTLNTLKLYKAAILKFHQNPQQFYQDADVLTLLKLFANTAPPVPLGRPHVDLQPTLQHIMAIVDRAASELAIANQVIAFLLDFTGLLRPSDLSIIVLNQCEVSGGHLVLVINSPKERKNNRRIIKRVILHPHTANPSLCPVKAFCMLCDHQSANNIRPRDALFVDSTKPTVAVQIQTISVWLRKLVRLSTNIRPTPSVRSLGSDLAILKGIPLDDVVTVGNWSSVSVLDTHYRRTITTQTNVTMTLLPNV